MDHISKLQYIDFKDLQSWSLLSYLTSAVNKSRYNLVKIGSFLKRIKKGIDIQDDVLYKRVTIKLYNAGVVLRDSTKGKNIGTKKQFIIKQGQLLLSKIDARNGAFGIVPQELDGGIITGNFWVFDIDTTQILPEILCNSLSSERFQKIWSACSNGTTNRHYLQEEAFLNTRIPVPSIEEQKNLLERYYLLIEQAKLAQIHCSWTAIDDILDRFLGIVSSNNSRKDGSCLLNIPFSSLLTWDVKNRQENILFETDKYKSVMLASLVDFNPSITKKLNSNAVISFVPMECVSDFDGTVTEYRECSFGSKGFTKFEDGDIIWAKITPCMQNGKSAIVNNMQNGVGYGSTEFYVIRRKSDKVLTEYLYYILRSERVRKEAVNYFSGSAGQQRVRKSFLQELNIPLPSLKEQQELVMLLNNEKKEINEKKKEFENLLLKAKQDFQTAIFS